MYVKTFFLSNAFHSLLLYLFSFKKRKHFESPYNLKPFVTVIGLNRKEVHTSRNCHLLGRYQCVHNTLSTSLKLSTSISWCEHVCVNVKIIVII